jgi:branched-chain amino acid aminotransferase
MKNEKHRVWLDGHIVDVDDARVSLFTHSLHYGLAVWDGIRAYRRADGISHAFRLREHVERLFNGCRMCFLEPAVSREEMALACCEAVRANGLSEAYVRPMVFVGTGAMGVYAPTNPVHVAVLAWSWQPHLGDGATTRGIRAKISSFARHHPNTALCKAKLTGQYANSSLARAEAKAAGYEEAILLDIHGHVSEASGSNVFLVRSGALYTPDLSSSILEGVTRDTIMTLASELGIAVRQEQLARDQLWTADEIFLTGTAAEIVPVREIDNRRVGAGTVGPITARLQERFFDVTRGSDSSHSEWRLRV